LKFLDDHGKPVCVVSDYKYGLMVDARALRFINLLTSIDQK